MAYIRLSKAKYQYQCDKCSRLINKGREYYRVEPFPIARIKGIEKVQRLCVSCVHGQGGEKPFAKETRNWLRYYWVGEPGVQNEQPAQTLEEPIEFVETRVYTANITPEILRILSANPREINNLTSEAFEELICNRLRKMGLGVERVGSHTFQKDGGIDIVAWPEKAVFPFLMAIQAKHHRFPQRKTGPGPVRELVGVVRSLSFNAGVLVTNTTFTPDARWVAEQQPLLVRLRDIHDIQRWLEDDFLDDYEWREMPKQIIVCPGVYVNIPQK